ncbi:MAG: cytochrome P450 [Myxococcota bacterium]
MAEQIFQLPRLPRLIERRGALRHIPGSDSYLELVHLLREPMGFFHERFNRYGRVFKTRLIYPVVFLVGADANRTLMITQRHAFSFGRGYAQTAVNRIFEGSIMLQDGEEHQRTRDILSPAVGRLAVRESAERVYDIWSGAVRRAMDGSSHDVYTVAQRATFDVAANALTGLELHDGTSDTIRPLFEDLIEGIMSATSVRFPRGRLDRALNAREQLKSVLRPQILKARCGEGTGLLGQLAHHRDGKGRLLEPDAVTEHLLLLFWAGYDTTASSAAWVLHMLGQRVDWQKRLRAELDEVVGDAALDIEARNRELPLLNAFLFEIERMYPSALFFPRIATEAIHYEGYAIPKGTPVFYSPYMTHRDPELFDNPNTFDPDRWDKSQPGGRNARPSALVGFGGGPRICLGKTFAKLQLKLMMHAILSQSRINPDPLSRTTIQGVPVHHPNGSRIFFESV